MFNLDSKSSNNWANNVPATKFVGKAIRFLPSCQSTNDIAMELIKESDLAEGSIIVTNHQTAGKGQRGNMWTGEPDKNLMMSVILKPTFLEPSEQFYLSMAIALANYKTLDTLLPGRVKIKWPNDLYVKEKKIAGILIENVLQQCRIQYSVVGIGINVNQEKMRMIDATSIISETNKPVDREILFSDLCVQIETYYLLLKSGNAERLKDEYLQYLLGFEESRLYEDNEGFFIGRLHDILPSGEAVLETDKGDKIFNIKEIRFVF